MEVEIIGLIGQLGIAGIFVYMFVKERKMSAEIRNEHVRDLRYIAQIRHDRIGDDWNGDSPGHALELEE